MMIAKYISSKILVSSTAAALLAALPVIAQQQPSGGSMPGQPQQSTAPNTPTGPGAYPGTGPTPQQSGADQEFVSKAFQGSDTEVELGNLAQQNSQSEDVKRFGQQMVLDHSQMNEKWFKPLAKSLSMSEPKGPSKKDKKLIAQLQALSGKDFDTEYIKVMVKDHQDDLKDFQTEAQTAQDPNVKQVAQLGTTVISKHLQMIEQIAKSHNVEVEGKEVSSTK
jgi:putative membrane protein